MPAQESMPVDLSATVDVDSKVEIDRDAPLDGRTTELYLNFPSGANGLVGFRLMIGEGEGDLDKVFPVNDEDDFVSLNDGDNDFWLEVDVDEGDLVRAVYDNADDQEAHFVNAILNFEAGQV